ncbi:MAG: hypothetical protein EOO89_12075 [Pedobacter sp.]|nr:MAG: hypothetical protein EOO89_12075 [Pedobacter sp.]
MVLYIKRWLVASLQPEDGTVVPRTKGVPQGFVIGPVLSNLYLHYAMDVWLKANYPEHAFERYGNDAVIHCRTEEQAIHLKEALVQRVRNVVWRCMNARPKLSFARTVTERENGDGSNV